MGGNTDAIAEHIPDIDKRPANEVAKIVAKDAEIDAIAPDMISNVAAMATSVAVMGSSMV